MKTNKITLVWLFLFQITALMVVAQTPTTAVNNTFYGQQTGAFNTGSYNCGFGVNTLINNTGNSNTAFGTQALISPTGEFNSAFGASAMKSNSTGSLNAAFGTRTLENNTSGSFNVAIGHRTMGDPRNPGNNNTAVGYAALRTNFGFGNVAIGYASPRHLLFGNNNIFIGNETALNLTRGNGNVFLGKVSVLPLTSSSHLVGNDTNNTLIFADGAGNQRLTISKTGFVGLGLGNNVLASNRLEVNGGAVIGINYVSKASAPGFSAPSNGLLVEGNVGIGTATPRNRLEITHGTAGSSGLRFTNLTNAFVPTTSSSAHKFLTVNATGDVVMENVATTNILAVNENNLTSTVNGVASSTPIINSVTTIVSENNQLTTFVNGVASASVALPSSVDEQNLSVSGNVLTISNGNSITLPQTVVTAGDNISVTGTGSADTPYVISSNDTSLYTANGSISQNTTTGANRVVNMNSRNIWFNTATSTSNGKIYIGNTTAYPTTTGDYRLYVEGGILTEKVKVALRNSANWADYVFENDYKLMPLQEVEAFIQKNKHLPGVASAEVLAKEGLDLGQMQAKHMEKIEELTLYVIDQNKKLSAQNTTIQKQQSEIDTLKAQVALLIQKTK
jgi:hypothetical protein